MANSDAWAAGVTLGTTGKYSKSSSQRTLKGMKRKAGKTARFVDPSLSSSTDLISYHNGGTVKKTGPALLKKGEVVVTAKNANRLGLRKDKTKRNARKRIATKG